MATVCLAVMARNEAHVIARCLASARPLVDSWVVLDTGSTDETIAVANEAMKGLPGDVVERPWRGFDKSRTELLELARSRADYALVLDADDVLEFPAGARFPELTDPGYQLVVRDGPAVYVRTHLFKSSAPWRYEGVLHEVAVCDGVPPSTRLEGIVYLRLGGGARSRDPQKYLKDAQLLEEEAKRDPTNARTILYLAQSYEDAGEYPKALAQFDRRVMMGGWPEEVFVAQLRGALIRKMLHFPREAIEDAFLAAWKMRPHRAEPLYYLSATSREAGEFERARGFALAAAGLPFPRRDTLPVMHEIYGWRALDELAAALVGLGDWDGAIDACRRLLARDLPQADRERVTANLASCEAARPR
jgi:glycosyltransferase involved in cell wall biosynthesis